MDRRRATWLTFIFIVIAAVAIFAWWFLFGQPKEQNGVSNIPNNSGGFDFFPITGEPGPRVDTSTTSDVGVSPQNKIPHLRQLSETPVAGATSYKTTNSNINKVVPTLFRWVERSTGNLFEVRDDNLTKSRISNTTIIGVQEAYFSKDAKKIIVRYLRPDNETIETALGEIKSVTSTTTTGLIFRDVKLLTKLLTPNIEQLAVSPVGDKFVELLNKGEGQLRVASFADGTDTLLFTNPLTEWNVSWPTTNKIAINSRPSSNEDGYLYTIDTNTGVETKILEKVPGLTASINPKGTRVLYSEAANGDLRLRVLNLATGSDRLLELRGLPEKCTWSQINEAVVYCGAPDRFYNGNYPTNWYLGLISFVDNIWRIDVDKESYTYLFNSGVESQKFDVYRPFVSEDDRYFVFINKKDLTLWSLETGIKK